MDQNTLNMDQNTKLKETPPVDPEVLKSARVHINKMKLHMREGIPFPGKLFVDDHEEMFKQITNLKFRPSDIISCGFSRSGNHWMFEVLNMILRQDCNFSGVNFLERLLEIQGSKLTDLVESLSEPRLLTSHMHPRFFLQGIAGKLSQSPPRIIYNLRSPKDALVSLYKFLAAFSGDGNFGGTWSEFFELQLAGEMVYGSWINHVAAWEKFIKDNPDVPVFVLQFEKLKENPVGVITDLCRFLGQPVTMAEDIAAATSFENMKAGTKEKEEKASAKYMKNGDSLAIGTGQLKTWKKTFTVDQNERFEKFFEECLTGNSLADLVREYVFA